jgi:hypothetical protein
VPSPSWIVTTDPAGFLPDGLLVSGRLTHARVQLPNPWGFPRSPSARANSASLRAAVATNRAGVLLSTLTLPLPWALASLVALCTSFWGRAARAEGPFDGAWSMSAVSENFTVQEWSAACGPAPVSGTMLGGGPVTVTGGGGELQISGGRRTLRTDQCLDPMPTLARNVHTQDARAWRTRCSTPPGDPRHAVVNTAYFVASGDSAISVAETGRYEFTINDSHCVADVRRGASLSRTLAATSGAATPADSATAATSASPEAPTALPSPTTPPRAEATAAPRADCATPGDAARLEVRPSRKLLKLGDAFAFHASVLDANGCPTGTPIQWAIGPVVFKDGQAHGGAPAIDASGHLTIPPSDFTEASFDVVATAAGKSAHASVEVSSPADYEALLAQSGLGPTGERDEPAVALLATTSIGSENARAEDGARKRRLIFIGVVGGLTLLLLVVAVVGASRSRKGRKVEAAAEARHAEKMRDYERHKAHREAQHAAQMKAHLESVAVAQQQAAASAARGQDAGPMFCPSCRREYPSGTTYCSFDSNRLVAIQGHQELMTGPSGGICPTCHRGFNPGVKVCSHDGDTLVPAVAAGVAQAPSFVPLRGKICPTCGGRFEGVAAFCVNDGTQLVLLN